MMSLSKLGAAADWSIPLFTPVAPVHESRGAAYRPEAALLSAMLVEVAKDAAYIGPVGDDAREWFASDNHAPYSFAWSCDVLGLEPDAIRARVLAQPRIPARPGRSTATAHYATAGGCRVLGCGWQGVDICTDPEKHNPACVRRGDARVVVPVIQRITPKCQRCGVETMERHEMCVRSKRIRVCAECVEAIQVEPKRIDPQVIEGQRKRDAIVAEAKRTGGRITAARARLLTGLSKGQVSHHLTLLRREGRIQRVALGVYEVIR